MSLECGQYCERFFRTEIAQRSEQDFLTEEKLLWSFSARVIPNNATFAACFEQTKTSAYEAQAYEVQEREANACRAQTHETQTRRAQACKTQSTRNASMQNASMQNASVRDTGTQGSPGAIIEVALASSARFSPLRQERRAEDEPCNSQRREDAEGHTEAVRIDAQIAT